MFKLLIFGGTTEGRQLAEYCAENGINADVSVATEYGASLLPAGVDILCGRLDADTEGLLLITDDGALGHLLLSPRRQKEGQDRGCRRKPQCC